MTTSPSSWKGNSTVPSNLVAVPKSPSTPVWQGPSGLGPQGGITCSLLNRFLSCRERFRLYAIEGWSSPPKFNHRIEYGNLWHKAEEVFAKDGSIPGALEGALDYADTLCDKYPDSRDEIRKWFNVLHMQFPVYVAYWEKHPDVQSRTPLLQEQVFDVPYKLPSGRVVRLRGKWDGCDLIDGGVWLVEHKTKGDVDEVRMQRQLTFDLQTMTYLVALEQYKERHNPISGIRYNVVRRPLSAGEGQIERHKPTKSNPAGESESEYYARLRGVIDGTGLNSKKQRYTGPTHWFYRWTVDVSAEDVRVFKTTFLDPCLEFLCAWYEHQTGNQIGSGRYCLHWRTPFGVTNPLDGEWGSEYDGMLARGSSLGLSRVSNLFPELQS